MEQPVADRMRHLILNALPKLEVTDANRLNSGAELWTTIGPLADFVGNKFPAWIRSDYAAVHVYFSLSHALKNRGVLTKAGRLSDICSPSELPAIADEVCKFWQSVPIDYEFLFPLASAEGYEAPTPIAPGITLKTFPKATDNPYSGLSGLITAPLGNLPSFLNLANLESDAAGTCLSVVGKGVMDLIDEAEIPASSAIRKAKIVLQLAKVERIGRSHSTPQAGKGPEVAIAILPSNERSQLRLPHLFHTSIGLFTWSHSLTDLPQAEFVAKFRRVAKVLKGSDNWNGVGRKHKGKPTPQDYEDQQCARIATAAEWLFDAQHATASATTLVQTAIAFESLYPARKLEKGVEPEPIVSTLSNRVAYSLGRSSAQRENIREGISEFYAMRSSVVHSGGTTLSTGQRMHLSYAQAVLTRALRHEMALATFEEGTSK